MNQLLSETINSKIPLRTPTKTGKGIKILTPSQMIYRTPIALAQLQARNNSQKLEKYIRQLLYSLYHSKKITKSLNNNLIKEYKMEKIFMNIENSKNKKPNRFRLTSADKINLKDLNKNIALVNLSIYCTWKNITDIYNNNKFKISVPTWNDEFELPDGSYSISDIQGYFEFINNKHEIITDNLPIQLYANRIKNQVVFEIKRSYRLELQAPKTMKLLGSANKNINKDKNGKQS